MRRHFFAILAIGISPDHGHAVGRVLARESERLRHERRADLLEADEADPGDGVIALELRPKTIRQQTRDDVRIDAEVDQHAALDHSLD